VELTNLTIKDFTQEVASKSPAPGGGSLAALCGALGAALSRMVANLSSGKKYESAQPQLIEVKTKAAELEQNLLMLVDKDTLAYNKVVEAFRRPKGSDQDKETRKEAIQDALKLAASAPFETLEKVSQAMPLVKTVIEKGNPNCITDAGVAAELIVSAAQGAAYNVFINLADIKDKGFSSELARRAMDLKSKTCKAGQDVRKRIETELKMG